MLSAVRSSGLARGRAHTQAAALYGTRRGASSDVRSVASAAKGNGHPGRRTAASVRSAFLGYFQSKGHTVVAPSGLVPTNDPTLLFTNAGMVQFKDAFLGLDPRPYTRATTCQPCLRAGGKHNDLDNVGFTPRHHTLFEMLGNFSFGDYFKEEAISYAWEFLTKDLGLPASRLRVSVHEDDDESANLWRKIAGIPTNTIFRFREDNFWSMGDGPGPCGPCTEIFWDQGDHLTRHDDRFLEVWNLVFMQYQRTAEGVRNNFETDELARIMDTAEASVRQLSTLPAAELDARIATRSPLQVIADHLRAAVWLIHSGVVPSNVGRGYVLRRIIRRAIRYGDHLGVRQPFLNALVPHYVNLCSSNGVGDSDMARRLNTIQSVVRNEELAFLATLHRGIGLLNDQLATKTPGDQLDPEFVFQLYDTYGFPIDLTGVVAKERGVSVDTPAVEAIMEARKQASRETWTGAAAGVPPAVRSWATSLSSSFVGYEHKHVTAATVVDSIMDPDGVRGWVCLGICPFYAESGGQVGDTGSLTDGTRTWTVCDSQKVGEAFVVCVEAADKAGLPPRGAVLSAQVDEDRRARITAHHSSTHLLQAALRAELGPQVMQAGSWVGADRLRFDFTHPQALTKDQLARVEKWVQQRVLSVEPVNIQWLSKQDALDRGAMAQFGEKYGSSVRVVSIGSESLELCGGCHVDRPRDAHPFKILSEGSIAAGVRRIEAVAGFAAVEWLQDRYQTLATAADLLKVSAVDNAVPERITKLQADYKELINQMNDLHAAAAKAPAAPIATTATSSNLVPIHWHELPATADPKVAAAQVKARANALVQRSADTAVIHVVICGGTLAVASTKSAGTHAGNLLRAIAATVGGKGGGGAEFAQGTLPVGMTTTAFMSAVMTAQL